MILIKLVESVLIFSVVLMHIRGDRLEADADDDVGGGHSRVTYDQRQSGRYNIHVVIKDVAIIEMDQNEIEDVDYSNEDYYYDESHLTVKPITLNPTIATTKLPSTAKISTMVETAFESADTTLQIQKDETTEATSIFRNTLLPNTASWFDTKQATSKPTKSSEIQHNLVNGPLELKSRSKVEPIYAIDETQLQSKSRDVSVPLENDAKTLTNSKIYTMKVQRSHQSHKNSPLRVQSRRCRSHQYRDITGNCRIKRTPSGSMLKRLFSMLVTLPFVRGAQLDDN